MTKTLGLAAAALLALSVGACGGDDGSFDESAYCDAYQSARDSIEQTDFTQLSAPQFEELKSKIVDLRAESPPELEEDWNTISNTLDEFETILEDAGLSIDDLAAIQEGELPEGLDLEQLQQIGTELQEFAEQNDVEAATQAIEQDAEERCDIPAESEPS
jgi:hypothetical protein